MKNLIDPSALDSTDPRDDLYTLLLEFDTAMVTTRDPERDYHSRPMALVRVEHGGALYFATLLDAPEAHEIANDPETLVTVQSTTHFASITGDAMVIHSHDLLDELWSESLHIWFDSKDDPRIAILIVEPRFAEYWDQRGTTSIAFLFESLNTTGEHPHADETGTDMAPLH